MSNPSTKRRRSWTSVVVVVAIAALAACAWFGVKMVGEYARSVQYGNSVGAAAAGVH